jgi:hypothetical protein
MKNIGRIVQETRNKLTIMAGLAFAFFFAQAQMSSDFLNSGKVWNYVYDCLMPDYQPIYYNMMVSNDTVINNANYGKILYKLQSTTDWKLAGYIRQAGQKVFFLDSALTNEGIIYDFGLEIGDTITVFNHFIKNNPHYITVNQVDSVTINQQLYKRLYLNNLQEIWIEGVGSTNGFLCSGFNDTSSCHYQLQLMTENGDTNYCLETPSSLTELTENQLVATLYPNPVNGEINIKIDNSQALPYNVKIINTLGIVVLNEVFTTEVFRIDLTHCPSGIYILQLSNEKKQLIRKFIKQ